MLQKGIPKVLLPYFPPVRGGFFYAWNSAPIKTGQHLATPLVLIDILYPMDFKLRLGDKLTHPQELTFG
jgi:hypothetical protein